MAFQSLQRHHQQHRGHNLAPCRPCNRLYTTQRAYSEIIEVLRRHITLGKKVELLECGVQRLIGIRLVQPHCPADGAVTQNRCSALILWCCRQRCLHWSCCGI